jgi:hypothetical protein
LAVIVCWLAFVELYVTVQLESSVAGVLSSGASVHGLVTNMPVLSELVQVTVPVGAVLGAASVSVTLALQLVGSPAWNVLGVHSTVVEVVRSLTSIVSLPKLEACTEAGAGW